MSKDKGVNNNSIGVFDSGLGGLTVWREIRKMLPAESLLYFGDGKDCPYGDKPQSDIRAYTEQAVEQMLDRGCKLIVIACNTATNSAIRYLRKKYPGTSFVGLEPAVKPAAVSTVAGRVAVLATEASLTGKQYRRTSNSFARGVDLYEAVGLGFVELVEENMEGTPEALEIVRKTVGPLVDADIDRLVLGCTHYPFLTGEIKQVIADKRIKIIHSGPAVARRVRHLLDKYDLRASADNEPVYEFMSKADDSYIKKLKEKSVKALDMEM